MTLQALSLEPDGWARLLIEERYTWPVRTVLEGGGSLRATSYQIYRSFLLAQLSSAFSTFSSRSVKLTIGEANQFTTKCVKTLYIQTILPLLSAIYATTRLIDAVRVTCAHFGTYRPNPVL
jgi:hypothetical protein